MLLGRWVSIIVYIFIKNYFIVYLEFSTYHVPMFHVHQCSTNLLFMAYPQINKHATNLSQVTLIGQFSAHITIWILFTCHRNQHILRHLRRYIRLFYGISDNMDSLVQYDKYGAINTSDTKNVYYVIKFISEAYTL